MDINFAYFSVCAIFILGYVGIIMEHTLKVNKTAVAIFVAILCWAIYFYNTTRPIAAEVEILNSHVSEIAQIIFFLLGAA